MPYSYRKIRNQDSYKVFNTVTGKIHSNHTTLDKAKAQVRLLESLAKNEPNITIEMTEKKKRGRPRKVKIGGTISDDEADEEVNRILETVGMEKEDPIETEKKRQEKRDRMEKVEQAKRDKLKAEMKARRDAGITMENDITALTNKLLKKDGEGIKTGCGLKVETIRALLKASYADKPADYQNWKLDKSLSGKRVQVYKDQNSDQAVVVHRGTKGAKDWATDFLYATGTPVKETARFKHSADIQKKAEAKYGANNITTLGHSLGAAIATVVGQSSKEIINLNKAVSPADALTPVSDKETNIRSSSDIVSSLLPVANSKKTITIPAKTYNPRSEHKTSILRRLDPEMVIGSGMVVKRGRGRPKKGGAVPPESLPLIKAPARRGRRPVQENPLNIPPPPPLPPAPPAQNFFNRTRIAELRQQRIQGRGLRSDALKVIVDGLFLDYELYGLKQADFEDRLQIIRGQLREARVPPALIDEIIQEIRKRMMSPSPSPVGNKLERPKRRPPSPPAPPSKRINLFGRGICQSRQSANMDAINRFIDIVPTLRTKTELFDAVHQLIMNTDVDFDADMSLDRFLSQRYNMRVPANFPGYNTLIIERNNNITFQQLLPDIVFWFRRAFRAEMANCMPRAEAGYSPLVEALSTQEDPVVEATQIGRGVPPAKRVRAVQRNPRQLALDDIYEVIRVKRNQYRNNGTLINNNSNSDEILRLYQDLVGMWNYAQDDFSATPGESGTLTAGDKAGLIAELNDFYNEFVDGNIDENYLTERGEYILDDAFDFLANLNEIPTGVEVDMPEEEDYENINDMEEPPSSESSGNNTDDESGYNTDGSISDLTEGEGIMDFIRRLYKKNNKVAVTAEPSLEDIRKSQKDYKSVLKQVSEDRKRAIERAKMTEGEGIKRGLEKIKSAPTVKMANKWIEHIKSFAAKKGISYSQALKHPDLKVGYKKGGAVMPLPTPTPSRAKGGMKGSKRINRPVMMGGGMPTSRESVVAEVYNEKQMGANGGKNYISL